MMKTKPNISLQSYEQLFLNEDIPEESVREIDITDLIDYADHPFQVRLDEEMQELISSIEQFGQMIPIIVRQVPEGGYEIISGHRRKEACLRAGLKTVKAIVRELDNDSADILMVDSNLHREKLLPSEKAFAYRIRQEAAKHKDFEMRHRVASEDNIRTVQRYIRLTYLIPEMLRKVDAGQLHFIPAVTISYISNENQKLLLELMGNGKISKQQAEELRGLNDTNTFNAENVTQILFPKRTMQPTGHTVTLSRVRDYFPDEYSTDRIKAIIYGLLESWKQEHTECDTVSRNNKK